jgi:hypothetical protein
MPFLEKLLYQPLSPVRTGFYTGNKAGNIAQD